MLFWIYGTFMSSPGRLGLHSWYQRSLPQPLAQPVLRSADSGVESYQRLLEQFHVFHEAVRVVALLEPRTADSERAISEARITGI
jgi:hypothetical protein